MDKKSAMQGFQIGSLIVGMRKKPVVLSFDKLYTSFDPHTAYLAIQADKEFVNYGYGVDLFCTSPELGGSCTGTAVLTGDHLELTVEVRETTETEEQA